MRRFFQVFLSWLLIFSPNSKLLTYLRQKIGLCALLDILGFALIVALSNVLMGLELQGQFVWLLLLAIVYVFSGWLIGSYTVLRWPELRLHVVLLRLCVTGVLTMLLMAILAWLINAPVEVRVFHRSNLLLLVTALVAWSLALRLLFRVGLIKSNSPLIELVADPQKGSRMAQAWLATPVGPAPGLRHPDDVPDLQLQGESGPIVLAIDPDLALGEAWLDWLEVQDPRRLNIITPLDLAERQLERLPPQMIPKQWLDYSDLPANAKFSLQAQLKRGADIILSLSLLLVCSPVILLSALLIFLEDGGPIFYTQMRSGFLGHSFRIFKLRTMAIQSATTSSSWTEIGDRRITKVGLYLRKFRIDELPQLWNVIIGDMSLIGPRPEQPELETLLESSIPHYRKRHWMRPGLSGWAQVCAHYAGSVEDSEIKLSFDLYYLKHFNTWLDFLILMKTIKTVLKAKGR